MPLPPARLIHASTLAMALVVTPVRAQAPDPLAAMREGAQPGCAVAVLTPAGPRFDAAGLADVAGGVAITPRTRFLIASASKQVTALAVLSLVDAGRIGLDDPAARRLPDMAGALQGATVRQLLNQTAGVRDHTTLMALSASNA
jgi:CubicO group peptidase (beta-lactamase class C family)